MRGSWLGRLLLERGIGFICLLIFLNAWNQFRPLLGERGLLRFAISSSACHSAKRRAFSIGLHRTTLLPSQPPAE